MLYYPDLYKPPGAEQERHSTGQATQQIRWGPGLGGQGKGHQNILSGGFVDYIGRTDKIARKHIENNLKQKVVGEEFYPLGNTNFNSLINKIKAAKPDLIAVAVVGGSNVAFAAQGRRHHCGKAETPTISAPRTNRSGSVKVKTTVGFHWGMKYFQSLTNDNNKKFVAAFKEKYGPKSVIGDVTQAAYLGPWLWKFTVEKAGSFDVKIAAAPAGSNSPAHPRATKIDENHHLWSKARIGEMLPDGQFKVVAESPELIKPDPFPKG